MHVDFYLINKMASAAHKVHKWENAVFSVSVISWWPTFSYWMVWHKWWKNICHL